MIEEEVIIEFKTFSAALPDFNNISLSIWPANKGLNYMSQMLYESMFLYSAFGDYTSPLMEVGKKNNPAHMFKYRWLLRSGIFIPNW